MEKIKSYLKRAKHIDKDIESKLREREQFYSTLLQSPSIKENHVQESNRPNYDDKYMKLMELGEQIDEYIDQVCAVRLDITERIDKVDDGLYKAILRDYYLNNLTWEKIAELNRQSVRNVHTLHRSALVVFRESNADMLT